MGMPDVISIGNASPLKGAAMTSPSEEYRLIPLTKGQFAIVDVADYEWLNQYSWYANWSEGGQSFYAGRNSTTVNGKRHGIWMHREVMGIPYGDPRKVDHREPSETLNNRRYNLRVTNPTGNNCNVGRRKDNTSGQKGVTWDECTHKWKVQITIGGVYHYLGLHPTLEIAREVYCEAAARLHGEFARTQ